MKKPKTTAQIIDEDKKLTRMLSEIFLWIGHPYSVEAAVIQLRDELHKKHGITFEIYT